jgi:hypothetical protein
MLLKLIEPPVATIDWNLFRHDVQSYWDRYEVWHRKCGVAGGTSARFWYNGSTIPLKPFLMTCKKMGKNPLNYLIER